MAKEKQLTVFIATLTEDENEPTGFKLGRGVVTLGNSLADMQSFVGGYVECVTFSENLAMWVNEEGKLTQLPLNFALVREGGTPYDVVAGNAFFTHGDPDEEGNTRSITPEGIEEARALVAAGEINERMAMLLSVFGDLGI